MNRTMRGAATVALLLALGSMPANAVHFYRGTGGGCTPADGQITDNVVGPVAIAARVQMLHNTFNDAATLLPVTRIKAGQAVQWTWNSAHCHSVTGSGIQSGFHYPTTAPNSPTLLPGFFDYPIPETEASLSFVHVFPNAGTFTYSCVHHGLIGMAGVVIVE